jgi:hypothetical protein
MLNAIMLSVVMLNVVAPTEVTDSDKYTNLLHCKIIYVSKKSYRTGHERENNSHLS